MRKGCGFQLVPLRLSVCSAALHSSVAPHRFTPHSSRRFRGRSLFSAINSSPRVVRPLPPHAAIILALKHKSRYRARKLGLCALRVATGYVYIAATGRRDVDPTKAAAAGGQHDSSGVNPGSRAATAASLEACIRVHALQRLAPARPRPCLDPPTRTRRRRAILASAAFGGLLGPRCRAHSCVFAVGWGSHGTSKRAGPPRPGRQPPRSAPAITHRGSGPGPATAGGAPSQPESARAGRG